MRLLAAMLVTWSVYVISVGGDFMEFRFLVPVMPFGMILLVSLIMSFRRQALRIALVALVIAGSILHAATFRAAHGIASIDDLKRHLVNADEDWIGIGTSLHRLFYGDRDEVSIATTAAGAIPYYSGLRTIDQMGINDKFVARRGVLWATRPGHQRLAPHAYLRGVGVNLVIGHPRVSPIARPFRQITTVDALEEAFHVLKIEPDKIPRGAGFIDIPVNQWYKVTVFYLTPSKAVDRAIEQNKLRVYPLTLER
jgi:arabinofuranosyltransferase